MFNNDKSNRRRVVVTGLGIVSPLGNDLESNWQGLIDGVCGVAPITKFDTSDFPCTVAAEVKEFNPLDYLSRRDARRMPSVLHYAVAAAQQAITQAQLDIAQEDPTRIGVEVGSGLGAVSVSEEQRLRLDNMGYKKLQPATVPAMLISMPASFISIHFGLRGPVNVPVSACATGISGIGEGMRRIVWGDADVMLVGGTDSCITRLVISAFSRMTALTGRSATPERCITPFDAERDGTVIGEGAGVLALESLEHAQARNATILAEVKGYGMSSDAYHISSPRQDGEGAARAMRNALNDSNLSPDTISYIAAHGTGTQMNDAIETKAIKHVFRKTAYNIPISSIKGMTGHTLGAAGAIGAVATIKAMQEGTVPPTIGLHTPDPACDLDYVPNKARNIELNTALVNGFGFGGQNASIVLQKWNGA
ncbi:beta-ketoacyl-ACP synthase II [Anaerolineales bacterium HSG6]|nr:beta-ketoacyl-ACP synthase II [Anaerolineales bacterium HSG6]